MGLNFSHSLVIGLNLSHSLDMSLNLSHSCRIMRYCNFLGKQGLYKNLTKLNPENRSSFLASALTLGCAKLHDGRSMTGLVVAAVVEPTPPRPGLGLLEPWGLER